MRLLLHRLRLRLLLQCSISWQSILTVIDQRRGIRSVQLCFPLQLLHVELDGRRETQLGTFGCVWYWLLIMFEDLWHLCVPLQIFCLSSFSGNKNSRSFILRSLNSDGNIVVNLIFPSWPERLWNPPSGQQSRWVHLGPAWLPPGIKVSTCTFVPSHSCT